MAITYVNSAKFPTAYPGGTSNNISTVTINKPTNTAQNDVLVAFILSGVPPVTHTTVPSGWTLLSKTDNGSNLTMWIYWRVAGASEPASYTWVDDTGNGAPACGLISAWRGALTSDPIDNYATSYTTTTDPTTTPTVSSTWPSVLPIHMAFARTTTTQQAITTQGTFANGSGQTERMNPANRGGTVEYAGELSSSTAGTHTTTPGSQSGVTFDFTQTPTNGAQAQVLLKADIPQTSAPADVGAASATANSPSSLTITTDATVSADTTATAYNATVLTGVAALAGVAAATASALNPRVVFTGIGEAGASAFNATVALGASAGCAAASVTAPGAVPYFGAPESRRWRIPAEDRTWPVPAESRAWLVEPESRAWYVPSEDN